VTEPRQSRQTGLYLIDDLGPRPDDSFDPFEMDDIQAAILEAYLHGQKKFHAHFALACHVLRGAVTRDMCTTFQARSRLGEPLDNDRNVWNDRRRIQITLDQGVASGQCPVLIEVTDGTNNGEVCVFGGRFVPSEVRLQFLDDFERFLRDSAEATRSPGTTVLCGLPPLGFYDANGKGVVPVRVPLICGNCFPDQVIERSSNIVEYVPYGHPPRQREADGWEPPAQHGPTVDFFLMRFASGPLPTFITECIEVPLGAVYFEATTLK
jgi:hypothetical protein